MDLLEHLGKAQLADAGIRVPRGGLARTPSEAAQRAAELAGRVALKAQVPAGKRGKSGAIRFAETPADAESEASELLGRDVDGFPVTSVLVEEQVDIATELYAAVTIDASARSPLILFSAEGGMDIEELGATHPERILRHTVEIRRGVDRGELLRLVEAAGDGVPDAAREAVAGVIESLYRRWRELDAQLLEVNPLVVDRSGEVIALDCKLTVDDAARPRLEQLVAAAESDAPETGTALEREGRRAGLLYIELDGDVGVLANGAGLTMATMDAVGHFGGRAANFLEIGGDAYTKATPALRLVLSNPRVKSLLVNFCGAFARTDVMTEGVVAAIEELRPTLPISFSIHGTGEEEAIALVRRRLGHEPYDLMEDAVKAAVDAAAAAPGDREEGASRW
jgi:succinyl-CoA synthetase beta subunit